MIRKNLTNQITFILPTKKRVIKATNFILKCNKNFKKINPNFLIITSNKIEANFFERKFRNSKNIKIIIQKKSGFMNACFESIAHIQSKFCTFFYDDDKISPHSIKLFQNVLKENIVMGYGLVSDNLYDNKFQSIKINKISKKKILLSYFGERIDGVKFMPVSPVCLIFRSSFLLEWKKIIFDYCKNNLLRKDLLLNQNIGPDLILYLHQIIKKKYIYFARPNIAKFVIHNKSMSYLLGKNKLRIGYWLAKKTLVHYNKVENKKIEKFIFSFLLISGLHILILNFFLKLFKKDNYFDLFKKELIHLFQNKKFKFSIFYSLKIIFIKLLR